MDIAGIEGASTYHHETGSVEVFGWKHAFKHPVQLSRSSGTSGSAGKAKHKNMYFTKQVDKTTRDLLKKCWEGVQIPKITISSYNADVKYLEIVIEKAIISSYRLAEEHDLPHPVERIGFNYAKIKYSYVPVPVDDSGMALGKLPVEHNLETGIVA